jgi:hypothetical protein
MVSPLSFPTYNVSSAADFTPLARLGQQLRAPERSLASLAETPPSSDVWSGGAAPVAHTGGSDQFGRAISGIESGGRYDLRGPVTKSGDRAYGKYQVMGANIPEWSRAALGRSMTPDEFLADTNAQEAVFKHRFGQYVDRYGPTGAAKAWFAGEGGMNNPNASDLYGTTVASYARRFNAGLGDQ